MKERQEMTSLVIYTIQEMRENLTGIYYLYEIAALKKNIKDAV